MKIPDNKNKFIVFISMVGFLLLIVFTKNIFLKNTGFSDVLGGKQLPTQNITNELVATNYPLTSQTQTITESVPVDLHGAAPQPQQGVFIDPATVNGMLASSYQFTSETNTPTGPVPIQADWSATLNQQGGTSQTPLGILLQNCTDNSTCTLQTGVYPQKLILTVQSKDGTAQASINVSSDFPPNPFTDDVPSWAEVSVYYLYKIGVVHGYIDGRFGSVDPVTRGQVVLMLDNLMTMYGFDTTNYMKGKSCDGLFADVPSSHYAYQAVCLASYLGWLNQIQTPNKDFMPDTPMTRGEVAQVITNLIGTNALNKLFSPSLDTFTKQVIASIEASMNFADVEPGITPNYGAIGSVYVLKIMDGYYGASNGLNFFHFASPINRAEMAKTIVNLVQYLQQS